MNEFMSQPVLGFQLWGWAIILTISAFLIMFYPVGLLTLWFGAIAGVAIKRGRT